MNTYKIFINGKFFNASDNYSYIFNRALGVALLLKLDFVNTKSPNIIDKWVGKKECILITKKIIKK